MSPLIIDDASGSAVPCFGWTGGTILRRFAFGLSDSPSFTKNVAVQPFPTPSLSSQMFPCIRETNLKAPERAYIYYISVGNQMFSRGNGFGKGRTLLVYLLERARPNPLPLCNLFVPFCGCANFVKV